MTAALRLGIAGLGQAGAALVPAGLRNPNIAITAVADPRQELLHAFVADIPAETHTNIESLCRNPNVDLIYIATPTHLHTEHALLALNHGKHLIVEKPMALSLKDASATIDAAERNRVHLIVGHSQSFEPPVRAMREVVRSGAIGPIGMLHNWYYTDWLYRPRTPAELDTSLGGGVVFRQGAHQVDLLRWIAGGLVRSVRAATGTWDPARPTEGAHTLFLEFENGAFATAVFSGYDHFKTTELTFNITESGRKASEPGPSARERLRATSEAAQKRALGYGTGSRAATPQAHQSFYGLTVVSCQSGDIRQSENGLHIHGDNGLEEVHIPTDETGRDILLQEACDAVIQDRPPAHGGRWGMANLEVTLAALESARTHQEIRLHHQVPTPD